MIVVSAVAELFWLASNSVSALSVVVVVALALQACLLSSL